MRAISLAWELLIERRFQRQTQSRSHSSLRSNHSTANGRVRMPEVCCHTAQCATALCEPHLNLKLPCTLASHLLSCRGDPPEPEYRSIVWATAAALRLAGRRVLTNMETKKMLLQSLVALMSTPHAKHTDPALLLEYLLLVKNWLLEPQGGGNHAVLLTCVNMRLCGGYERLRRLFRWQWVSVTPAPP